MNEQNRMDWKLKRISKGIKQNKIAELLFVSGALISQFENNKSDMNSHLIEQYKAIISDQK